MTDAYRAGTVALVGRPNAGKSTLLNALLGQKLSIVSHRPQTTRNRIVGVLSEPDWQAVLVDTPGLHRPTDRINKAMVGAAQDSLVGVDATVWVVDARRVFERVRDGRPAFHKGHAAIQRLIEDRRSGTVVIALNKVDQVPRPQLLPILAAFSERVPGVALVPISALKADGLDRLKEVVLAALPEGPPLYPEDQLTDQTERFLVAELVREKVFHLTRNEVPYGTAVVVEEFTEHEAKEGHDRGFVHIFARINVERDSQRGILIGKGGQMLKRIGTEARRDVEALLGTRVHLELHVSVSRDWTRNPRVLRALGLE